MRNRTTGLTILAIATAISVGAAAADVSPSAPRLDESLRFLEDRIAEAVETIKALQSENDGLRQVAASLKVELENVAGERSEAIAEYRSRLSELARTLESEREDRKAGMAELDARIRELADTLSLERSAAATLQGDIAAIETELRATAAARDDAKTEAFGLRSDLETARGEAETLRDRMNAAAADADRQRGALAVEKETSEAARRRLELLNRQIAALRDQLAALGEALGASEAASREQRVVIADLGQRLNQALASKVAELARYRSEFLGRLRIALGDRADVRIVGERFVFQSEVLFGSGEADLNPAGRGELQRLAATLKEVAAAIPPELEWVLRVDGHTDRRPIATARFPSNWELSTARAVAVAKFLVEQGLPPNRLAATGFGEFHPLDPRDDDIAFRRNRRIEFTLTQR